MIQRDLLQKLKEVGERIARMYKPSTPQKLAEDILERSKCAVQVGAVIADRHGIFAWGWNHEGDGRGLHAEVHAIGRANRRRLRGASIYIAGKRKRNGIAVPSLPCDECYERIATSGIARIYWRDKDRMWNMKTTDWRLF